MVLRACGGEVSAQAKLSKPSGPLQGIIGRFHKDGSTEYRKGSKLVILTRSPNGRYFLCGQPSPSWDWWMAALHYPTRKDAIERIEYLLTR